MNRSTTPLHSGSPTYVAHALPQRLERGPAIADLRGVPAHELVSAVIDDAEEPTPAVLLGVSERAVPVGLLAMAGRGRQRVGRDMCAWAGVETIASAVAAQIHRYGGDIGRGVR
jgi:hypothetical protein